jgi:PhzF family phenazine biosynthesis protein
MESFAIDGTEGKDLPYYHVDAFTDEAFTGNPAGVVLGAEGLPDSVLQAIAAENNLSETAFVLREYDNKLRLRWFTPIVEVDLCGHATLAAAYVLFRQQQENKVAPVRLEFRTRSGTLEVQHVGDRLVLNFPSLELAPAGAEDCSWLRTDITRTQGNTRE